MFPAVSITAVAPSLRSSLPPRTNAARLRLPPTPDLFGVATARAQLAETLQQATPPWLVAIDGLGGIGKTSLAVKVVQPFLATDRFYDVAWVSAKQEEFLLESGIRPVRGPALTGETLVDQLLEQLGNNISLARSTEEKQALLTDIIRGRPYLVLIDNLETLQDYEAIFPLLRLLMGPTKFLLTSRHKLHAFADLFGQSLGELNEADTIAFLRHEAAQRNIVTLAKASQANLIRIREIVGGNPLALKLVVGQLSIFPLTEVLENLRQAKSKAVDELYTYIYWQAWHALDEVSQEVLLTMPITQGGTLEQIFVTSEQTIAAVHQALAQLVRLSLVQVGGDSVDERRYYIHRLTETFLLQEVVKWQPSA
jgi:hypothetical protein